MYTDNILKEEFYTYLKEKGYKEYTPSGNKSTLYDYLGRIERICKDEGITWNELLKQINKFVQDYDKNGVKSELGEKSHRAVINALKRYQEFSRMLDNEL